MAINHVVNSRAVEAQRVVTPRTNPVTQKSTGDEDLTTERGKKKSRQDSGAQVSNRSESETKNVNKKDFKEMVSGLKDQRFTLPVTGHSIDTVRNAPDQDFATNTGATRDMLRNQSQSQSPQSPQSFPQNPWPTAQSNQGFAAQGPGPQGFSPQSFSPQSGSSGEVQRIDPGTLGTNDKTYNSDRALVLNPETESGVYGSQETVPR